MPTIAAAMVPRPITSGLTIPFPMVVATAVPDNAPSTFSTAAISRAEYGRKTRVETTVAMAFGASVKPFTNSAAKTSSNTTIRPAVIT